MATRHSPRFPCFTLALLTGGASFCSPTFAQIEGKEGLIPYSRPVPKSALRLMPRGARSLFWGKFNPKKHGAQMAIHVYSPTRKPTSKAPDLYTYFYQVDVFRQSRGVFKRISHVNLANVESSGRRNYDFKYISKLQLTWLNNKMEDPVIIFDYFTTETEAGFPYGSGTVIVFDPTWKHGKDAGNFSFGWTGGAGSQWGYKALLWQVMDPETNKLTGTSEFGVSTYMGDMNGTTRESYSYDPEKGKLTKSHSEYDAREQ